MNDIGHEINISGYGHHKCASREIMKNYNKDEAIIGYDSFDGFLTGRLSRFSAIVLWHGSPTFFCNISFTVK